MTMLDPKERSERGKRVQTELLAAPATEPTTLLDASWRDYVFSEVWTRPGLDRRSRYIISICSAVCSNALPEILQGYIRGALKLGDLTLAELREAALHLAVYKGWSQAVVFDRAITAAAKELGLAMAPSPQIREKPWDSNARYTEGAASYLKAMAHPAPPPKTAYFEGGILNFVFGEMWLRPGLDQRARRWVTLVCVADSSSSTPIRSHVWAAIKTGDATGEELFEFVLQYAIHGSWPKASVMQGAVTEMLDRVEKGQGFM